MLWPVKAVGETRVVFGPIDRRITLATVAGARERAASEVRGAVRQRHDLHVADVHAMRRALRHPPPPRGSMARWAA